MTLALALVSLAGVLGFVRLWSLRKSRGALLTVAVPAALLPLAAAVAAGAWDYRADWERIAETGSGGLATFIGYSRDWIQLLLVGCAAGIGILATGVVLASRRRDRTMPAGTSGWRYAAVIAVAVVVAGATLPIVLARSERAAVAPLVKLVPIASPASRSDFGYPEARAMRTEDLLVQLERDLRVASIGGAGLVVVLAVCLLLGGRMRPFVSSGRVAALSTAVVVAVMGAGVWYGLHAQSVTRLLDATARQ